jgi:hypothetical protein
MMAAMMAAIKQIDLFGAALFNCLVARTAARGLKPKRPL